jgi:hypothetical protein
MKARLKARILADRAADPRKWLKIADAMLKVGLRSTPAFAHPLPPCEIKPTPDMLARAERQIPRGPEPIDGKGNEYHFRNLGREDLRLRL